MQEKPLLYFSLTISLTGLLSLFLIASNINFDATPIGEISKDDTGRGLKACGSIEDKFTSSENHTFFTLVDKSGEIEIVVFSSTRAAVGTGQVCVTGKVDLYEGDLEIIAKEVESV